MATPVWTESTPLNDWSWLLTLVHIILAVNRIPGWLVASLLFVLSILFACLNGFWAIPPAYCGYGNQTRACGISVSHQRVRSYPEFSSGQERFLIACAYFSLYTLQWLLALVYAWLVPTTSFHRPHASPEPLFLSEEDLP
uniref:Uncharacterized protein n=1 Tax=Pacific black duck sicinivirus-like virus TaxID=2759415 RepID=A0A7D7B5S5_9PICO|nr:hypothetical protein [Pacific black duck sicinivirus-like virus]